VHSIIQTPRTKAHEPDTPDLRLRRHSCSVDLPTHQSANTVGWHPLVTAGTVWLGLAELRFLLDVPNDVVRDYNNPTLSLR
jgi:hypothetical protein